MPLDEAAVHSAFNALCAGMDPAERRSPAEIARGCLQIAVANMASAIKKISVQRGYDVGSYTLCCFGGAAGQLACAVADALTMKRVYTRLPSPSSAKSSGVSVPRNLISTRNSSRMPVRASVDRAARASLAISPKSSTSCRCE